MPFCGNSFYNVKKVLGERDVNDGSKLYKNGEFLQKATMEEYIEMMVPFAAQAGMTGDQMREYCAVVYPTLKRWKK